MDAFDGPGISPDAASKIAWPEAGRASNGEKLTPAAVLVPLVFHDDGVTVLLTQRTGNLKSHAGQISFPGGQWEKTDRTPEDTALRERLQSAGRARARTFTWNATAAATAAVYRSALDGRTS